MGRGRASCYSDIQIADLISVKFRYMHSDSLFLINSVCVCVRACVRVCMRACVRACVVRGAWCVVRGAWCVVCVPLCVGGM